MFGGNGKGLLLTRSGHWHNSELKSVIVRDRKRQHRCGLRHRLESVDENRAALTEVADRITFAKQHFAALPLSG